MRRRSRSTAVLVLIAAVLLVGAACGSDDDDSSSTTTAADSGSDSGSGGGELMGVFTVTAGECAEAGVTTGSAFRMVESGGTAADGPFVVNADSDCGDPTWSSLSPGTDGGLMTGDYQPAPDPPFDGTNGAATAIIEPVTFFAAGFALSTEETDPTSSTATPAPTITADDSGALTGDLSSLLVSWNGQQFNQGSPKPDGSTSAGTTPVEGTYDADTGAYTLDWTSEISGGPFNGFIGVWHLEGVVETS